MMSGHAHPRSQVPKRRQLVDKKQLARLRQLKSARQLNSSLLQVLHVQLKHWVGKASHDPTPAVPTLPPKPAPPKRTGRAAETVAASHTNAAHAAVPTAAAAAVRSAAAEGAADSAGRRFEQLEKRCWGRPPRKHRNGRRTLALDDRSLPAPHLRGAASPSFLIGSASHSLLRCALQGGKCWARAYDEHAKTPEVG